MQAKGDKGGVRAVVYKVIFATNIFAILLLFSAYLSWKVSPLNSNLFSYIGLAYGYIILINFIYLLFWTLMSRWKLVLICTASIILCYKPITTYFPIHITKTEAPDKAIEVLTYNVQGFISENKKTAKERPIINYIAETDADIVLLQEYLVSKTGQSIISQQDINRLLNKYPYRSVTALGSSGKYHIFGLACFSKFPIENTEEVVFESSYNGASIYTINIGGEQYTVANVHLETNNIKEEDKQLYNDFLRNNDSINLEAVTSNIRTRLGKSFRARAVQVKKIKQTISNQETKGIIVGGDFNDTPISYAYHQMKRGLKDAYVSTAFGPGFTYRQDLFCFRIDHLMHSNNIKSYQTQIDRLDYSDHYPLRTKFELNASNN